MATGGEMTTAQYLIFVSPLVVTILVVFGMKYFSALFQARARMANDALYRTLAEKAVAVQSENQAALAAIRSDLTRFASSLATVEKILQQVE
jgi:signal transduction histidine kinase